MTVDRNTRLKDIIKTPAGHDIISRLLYSIGMDEKIVTKSIVGNLKLSSIRRLSMGRLDEGSIEAMLKVINGFPSEEPPERSDVEEKWWKEAVFYQIYPRSFYDSSGNGIGDIKGITGKLDYLKELGIDAIWCSPFYDSPNADNGYDIRDYKKIMAEFGTMEDVEELFAECHKRGIRIIIDLVMNHTSDEHEWFQRALKGEKKYEDYYIWADKPNNWESMFAGSAWKYIPEKDKYVLHIFDEKQIDLNWDNPEVRNEMYDIANFWLDKGADGFRLDVVSFISKAHGLPDGDEPIGRLTSFPGIENYFHGPHLDEYLREFNERCLKPHDAYTVGECPGNGLKMSRMITGDDRNELSELFSFEHLENPGRLRMDIYDFDPRKMIPEMVKWQTSYSNHCWPTVFFDNHDNPRMCSKIDKTNKYSREINKMLATIMMTFRGTPYIYQGDEIGMTNYPFKSMDEFRDVETFNFYNKLIEQKADKQQTLARMIAGSRDHARTPMQWNNDKNGGFSQGEPWIGVNPNYETINVEAEEKDENSVLNYYRRIIRLRKENRTLIYGKFEQISTDPDYFAYYRYDDKKKYLIIINLTREEKNYPFKVEAKLLSSTYPLFSNVLRPYEAAVFEVE